MVSGGGEFESKFTPRWLKSRGIFVFETSSDVALSDSFAFIVFFLAFAGGNDEFNIATAGE